MTARGRVDLDALERGVRDEGNHPGVANTLALIARVRELEKLADEALTGWDRSDGDRPGDEDRGRRIEQLREVLDKGTVLPW